MVDEHLSASTARDCAYRYGTAAFKIDYAWTARSNREHTSDRNRKNREITTIILNFAGCSEHLETEFYRINGRNLFK